MPGRDIIVVGTSAGGVEALRELVGGLPRDLPAAVFVVMHVAAEGTSVLPALLNRFGPLPAAHASDREPIQKGRIYVAPPDHHLLVEDGRMRVQRGPKQNRARPAVDPLFRSAAQVYGPRVIGVVLTGSLDDGTSGLAAIKQRGGVAIVQDPADALFPGMPRSALARVSVDHCVPITQVAPLLVQLAGEPAREVPARERRLEVEVEADMGEEVKMDEIGKPSVFACPECNGILWEVEDPIVPRYRCRVGHGYSAESLLADSDDDLEATLWAALRALEENAQLSRRVAARMEGTGSGAQRLEVKAREQEDHADQIRKLLRSVERTTAHA